ncbi:MAG TPA: 3-mercaptopyruvate sulfurtransferase [Rhizomicrobium sp.]|nr:3-mercaptopyruvate sulfurtransferase [Rhizomicrobium sp.]
MTTDWLAEHLAAPDVRVADASWYLPQAGRDAKGEYTSAHIPGAVFFDIDDLSDEKSPLPHMLAPAPKFASRMRRLGLGDGNLIVVYDGAGIYSAARAWWMLRAMGHEEVAVLDGGLPKWRAGGHPVEDLIPNPYPRHFTPRPNNALVRDYDQMNANLATRNEQVVDARGAERFQGKETEPRAGVKSGHMPGSVNIPYTEFAAADGSLKPREDLAELFAARGIDPGKRVVTTCGSGVTASIALLALTVLGAKDASLYDGSWAEWGARGIVET